MEYNTFTEKASCLLAQLEELPKRNQSNGVSILFGIDNLVRKIRHIIFAFNPELPLNKEIDRYYNCETLQEGDIDEIKKILSFFIEYVNDYYLR